MKQRLSISSFVRWGVLAVMLLACPWSASGYAVSVALSLDQLSEQCDLIFKGTVISSAPVNDEWFKSCDGFEPFETKFKVISVIKGDSPGKTLRFRHYDRAGGGIIFYQPLSYHFADAATYMVFAKKADAAGVFRQFSPRPSCKEDQGMLRCASESPVTGKGLKEVVWNELLSMLKAETPAHTAYAIQQLDEMSFGEDHFRGTHDFDRTKVLHAVCGSLKSGSTAVVQAAITLLGSQNPYMRDDFAAQWLDALKNPESGHGLIESKMKNPGSTLYWEDLCTIADSNTFADTRALAIRALGMVRKPALREELRRWLADPDSTVRSAAIVLLSDFPGTEANGALTLLDADRAPAVRVAVTRAIAFSRNKELLPILVGLLRDPDANVRRSASQGLLSFSPKDGKVARVFRNALDVQEFDPLFLNELARENPSLHLEGLARVIENQVMPKNWSGGTSPPYDAWKILFKHVTAQPAKVVKSGALDRCLDALTHTGNVSSSEPRDLYAFLLRAGLPERAQSFRAKAVKAATYDLDYYFKQVDAEAAKAK